MTVFKTFLKVCNKYKGTVILYTAILLLFGCLNQQNGATSTDFVTSEPDILIVNQDESEGITKSLISYMEANCKIIDVEMKEEARDDALFYRDVNYIIYIPSHYREDFLNGKNPEIEIKSTGDYQSSLADILLKRYLRLASFYQTITSSEEEIIRMTEEAVDQTVDVEMTAKLDTNGLNRATTYYNFANYCILAGCIYVVCLILSSFKSKGVWKRTIVSSTKYQKLNRTLLFSNGLFAFSLWLFYCILSFILVGKTMVSIHGCFYLINSFLFTFCALTLAFLISSFLNNKNAVNGLVNVIALGSSFLCGAFVPMEWLPDYVLKIAHILPSYWYIKTNEYLKTIEVFDFVSLKPMIWNMLMLCCFCLLFVLITNVFSSHRRRLG